MDSQLPIERLALKISTLQSKQERLNDLIASLRANRSSFNPASMNGLQPLIKLVILPATLALMVTSQLLAFTVDTCRKEAPAVSFIFDGIDSLLKLIVQGSNWIVERGAVLLVFALLFIFILLWDVLKPFPFQLMSLGLSLRIAMHKFRMQRLQNQFSN